MTSFGVKSYDVEIGDLRSKSPPPQGWEWPGEFPDINVVGRVVCRLDDEAGRVATFLFVPADVEVTTFEGFGTWWIVLPHTLLPEFLATIRHERPLSVHVEDWGEIYISARGEPPGEQEDIDRFL